MSNYADPRTMAKARHIIENAFMQIVCLTEGSRSTAVEVTIELPAEELANIEYTAIRP